MCDIMFIFEIAPMFSVALVFFAFTTKLYSRSVSTFCIIISASIPIHLSYFGCKESALAIVLLTLTVLLYRAMMKEPTDTIFVKMKKGLI